MSKRITIVKVFPPDQTKTGKPVWKVVDSEGTKWKVWTKDLAEPGEYIVDITPGTEFENRQGEMQMGFGTLRLPKGVAQPAKGAPKAGPGGAGAGFGGGGGGGGQGGQGSALSFAVSYTKDIVCSLIEKGATADESKKHFEDFFGILSKALRVPPAEKAQAKPKPKPRPADEDEEGGGDGDPDTPPDGYEPAGGGDDDIPF